MIGIGKQYNQKVRLHRVTESSLLFSLESNVWMRLTVERTASTGNCIGSSLLICNRAIGIRNTNQYGSVCIAQPSRRLQAGEQEERKVLKRRNLRCTGSWPDGNYFCTQHLNRLADWQLLKNV